MMGWDWGWGWGMMAGGFLVWAVLLILLVWLVSGLFRPAQRAADRDFGPRAAASQKMPLDLLQERYARGEINRDEYLTMRQDLEAR